MGVPRDQIKGAAQMRITEVLRALGIDGQVRGQSLILCNPIRGEKTPSLQIWIKPGYEGAWKDYGAGLQGDVFDLVAYFNGFDIDGDRGFARAAAWLTNLLGLGYDAHGRPDPAHQRRLDEQQRRDVARREQMAAERETQARRNALGLWLKGTEKLAGTPVETYLRAARGLDIRKLKRPPTSVRYLSRHVHRESGEALPCMAALMQGGDGRAMAVHRTWLNPQGTAKANVAPARKIWPTFTGAIIALARGASDLPVKEANANGIADTLVLAEGVEDGLSFAVADPSVRVWAVGSIANLAHVPVPPCASDILVSVDNDWGKPQAQAQLQRGLDYLAGFGVPVITMRSPYGKDANDLIRGGVA